MEQNSHTTHLLKARKDDKILELKKHYTNEQTGISYTLHGDFYLPDIKPAEENISLGKWGMMHNTCLEKHKKALFNSLLMQGKLYQHCAEVEAQARDMIDTLVEQTKKAEGVTEQLKEHNQWEMGAKNVQHSAKSKRDSV